MQPQLTPFLLVLQAQKIKAEKAYGFSRKEKCRKRISPSADGDKGYAPLTALAF